MRTRPGRPASLPRLAFSRANVELTIFFRDAQAAVFTSSCRSCC
jgi:hypothetical protein